MSLVFDEGLWQVAWEASESSRKALVKLLLKQDEEWENK
jgi:hypothetical protein